MVVFRGVTAGVVCRCGRCGLKVFTMTTTQQATKNAISLKGSAQIVCEYLKFGINSILYQRGIYPSESFRVQPQYDIPLFISEDPEIKNFLNELLTQGEEWILNKKINKVSLIIVNVATKEVMECWEFNVEYETGDKELTAENKQLTGNKELKKIQQEIREVMRQIAATISFLPLIDCRCSFDILLHSINDCEVPEKWSEAAPIHIVNAQNVQLKSFSTSLHKVETVVNYRMVD